MPLVENSAANFKKVDENKSCSTKYFPVWHYFSKGPKKGRVFQNLCFFTFLNEGFGFTALELPSKLLTSTGFSRKIFFSLNISSRWLPCEKIDRAYKIRVHEMPKSKFWFCTPESPHKSFSDSVEVTSWASNFDRYIYLLKIMPFFQRTGDVSYPIQFLHSNGYFPTMSLKLYKKIMALKGQ